MRRYIAATDPSTSTTVVIRPLEIFIPGDGHEPLDPILAQAVERITGEPVDHRCKGATATARSQLRRWTRKPQTTP